MLNSPLAKISTLLATAVVAWAFARGRWPERVAALALAVDWFGGVLFQDRRPYHHGQPMIFALDVVLAVVMLTLVAASRRTWVLWGAAFALLSVLTHLTVTLNASFGQWSYLTVLYIWAVGLVAALATGVAMEGRKPTPPPFIRRPARNV